jgi:hypothetical protein
MTRSRFALICLASALLMACAQGIVLTATAPPPTPLKTLSPVSTAPPQVPPKTVSPAPTAPQVPPKTTSPIPTPTNGRPTTPKVIKSRIYLPLISKESRALPAAISMAGIPTTTIPVNLGGLHIEATGDHTGYEEFLRACAAANRPIALIKVYGDGYSAKIAKSVDPRTVTIWRKPVKLSGDKDRTDNPPGDWTWPESATAEVARQWMQAMYPEWEQERAYIDYFEIVNEPNPATPDQTRRAADFMLEAMKDAERHDPPYRLAIWSFSSGTPEPWQAEIMLPSLRYAAEHGHILSVHDGSVDDERRLFRQAFKDGTALRYRMFQPLLGESMPRVAITEAYQPGGYYDPDWYDWQWYLTELSKDNVVGAAWFTLGPYSFGGGENVNVVKQLAPFALTLGCKP